MEQSIARDQGSVESICMEVRISFNMSCLVYKLQSSHLPYWYYFFKAAGLCTKKKRELNFMLFPQETGQTALTSTLWDKEQTISQLEGEIELLKSGMDAIVQIFTSGGDIGKVFGTREVSESNGKTEFWGDHVTGGVGHVTAMAGFQSPRKEGTESRARSTNPFLPSNQQEWLSSTVCKLSCPG